MTTKLTLEPTWQGETVLVLGGAPTLGAELAALGGKYHAVAANQAVTVAPWADMAVSIDANWRPETNGYQGIRIVGFESDAVDAHYLNMPHERVTLGPGNELHLRSNLISAIRIAAAMGAAKILVLGIDPHYYEANCAAPGSAAGIAAVMAELTAAGVPTERYTPPAEVVADPAPAAKVKAPRNV